MSTSNNMIRQVFGNKINDQITLLDAILLLEKKGLLNHGELTEQGVSNATRVAQCSKNHPKMDLINGAQIKSGLTGPIKGNRKYSYISIGRNGVQHGTTLYSVIRDVDTMKEYYFIFEWNDYWHQSGNTISIPFWWTGEPCRDNKWWNSEVTFEKFRERVSTHVHT